MAPFQEPSTLEMLFQKVDFPTSTIGNDDSFEVNFTEQKGQQSVERNQSSFGHYREVFRASNQFCTSVCIYVFSTLNGFSNNTNVHTLLKFTKPANHQYQHITKKHLNYELECKSGYMKKPD